MYAISRYKRTLHRLGLCHHSTRCRCHCWLPECVSSWPACVREPWPRNCVVACISSTPCAPLSFPLLVSSKHRKRNWKAIKLNVCHVTAKALMTICFDALWLHFLFSSSAFFALSWPAISPDVTTNCREA